jgi:hypothetical protein
MAGSFETIDLLLDRPSTGEASLSSRLLYKFLHNNLRIGQWELARACIGTLLKQDGNCGEIFAQLLKNVVDEPLLYRYFHDFVSLRFITMMVQYQVVLCIHT